MGTILDSQTRSIWSSPFIDKGHLLLGRVHIFERFQEQKIQFQPFLLLTLAFLDLGKDVMNGKCVTLLLFFLERH